MAECLKLSESYHFIRRITVFTILFYSPLEVFLLSKYLLRSMSALVSIKRLNGKGSHEV